MTGNSAGRWDQRYREGSFPRRSGPHPTVAAHLTQRPSADLVTLVEPTLDEGTEGGAGLIAALAAAVPIGGRLVVLDRSWTDADLQRLRALDLDPMALLTRGAIHAGLPDGWLIDRFEPFPPAPDDPLQQGEDLLLVAVHLDDGGD